MLKFQVETKGIQERPLITHRVLLFLLCSEVWFIPLAVSSISKQWFKLSRHSLDYGVIPHPHLLGTYTSTWGQKNVSCNNMKFQDVAYSNRKANKQTNKTQNKNTSRKGSREQSEPKSKCCQAGATEHHEHAVKSKAFPFCPSQGWQSSNKELKSPWWISFQAEGNFVLTLY